MKPIDFAYERPASVDAALKLLSEAGGGAKIIAGGQSLGPILNMRLVRPDIVIDVACIEEMRMSLEDSDNLVLGACTTHSDIEDGRTPDTTQGFMRAIAKGIAYRAVRNRGTIGGSLAHADPAADWVSALTCLGAACEISGPRGNRTVTVEDFILGALECGLDADELVRAVRVPKLSSAAKWGYYKVCRKPGEYAHAIGVFILDPERELCRAVLGATNRRPILVSDARDLFQRNANCEPGAFATVHVERLLETSGFFDSIDRRVRAVALRRAVERAFS